MARPSPRALDVAVGQGRHYDTLADAGFRVFGVDHAFAALKEARSLAPGRPGPLRAWCADLTKHPLPTAWFDLVLVTRYLQRDLFPSLKGAVVPGGIVIYETFTLHQLRRGCGPVSPHHLLEPGELRGYFHDFEVLFYEESKEPEALARLVALRPR